MSIEFSRVFVIHYSIHYLIDAFILCPVRHPSDNQHYEKIGKEVKCIEDEIPFEIPESWEWCRLGSCGNFIRGNGIKRNETTSNGIQCVRYGEIYTTYDTSFTYTVSYVSEGLAEKCKSASYGDALLTLTGENKIDIAKTIVYLGNERLVIGGDLAVYTNHHFDPLFLAFLLNSPYINYQKSVVASGDIIVHISAVKLSGILVAVPPLCEQKRIVSAIEEALPKVHEYGKYQSSLESLDQGINAKLKSSILQYAIQGKLVPQDPNDEPASVLLERIRAEKEQMIKDGKIKRDKNESYIYRGSDNSYFLYLPNI